MKTILITGVTRSGLTATMQMLDAGGYPCAGTFPAYEPFDIGRIPFQKLEGKAIKIVDTHTQFPPTGEYHVIQLKRDYHQQAKSIHRFLGVMTGMNYPKSMIAKSEKTLPKEYAAIEAWALRQKGYLSLDFAEIVTDPIVAALKLQEFTGQPLDVNKMAAVIIPRSPDLHPTLLEAIIVREWEMFNKKPSTI